MAFEACLRAIGCESFLDFAGTLIGILKLCRLGDITLVFTGATRSCDRYWVELAEILAARQRFRV